MIYLLKVWKNLYLSVLKLLFYWMLDAGYKMLDAGCRIQDAGWPSNAGRSAIVTFEWSSIQCPATSIQWSSNQYPASSIQWSSIQLCVCIYVCMYVCMHACMHAPVYVCTCVCMYVCIYARIYARTFVCYIRMHLCMYVCTHVSVYVCMCRWGWYRNQFCRWFQRSPVACPGRLKPCFLTWSALQGGWIEMAACIFFAAPRRPRRYSLVWMYAYKWYVYFLCMHR